MEKKNVARDLAGHTYNRLVFVLVLLFGSFTMSISQSSMSTAYPMLMKSFNIPTDVVQWITTGLMLIMCIMMPASPWFLNNVKFKPLFLGILATFDIGTLIILFAPNFLILMLGRALEALAMGVLFPSFQSVLLYITPKKQRGGVMGLAGLIMGSALACGPIVSGIILHFASWQYIFVVFMVIITVVFVLACFTIKNVMPQKSYHLDVLSVIYSIGLIGILYVISMVKNKAIGAVPALVILLISFAMIALFVHRQFHLKEPLLNLRVMKSFNYDLSVGLTCFSYIALIVVTIIFPLYYQYVLGTSKLLSGLALVPGAALLSLLNPVTGKLTGTIGFKKTMLIGMAMILAGWLLLFVLPKGIGIVPMMILAAVIESGNAFVMMPSVTMGNNSLPKALISHGTALITTMRQVMGSAGVVVASLFLLDVKQANVSAAAHTVALNEFHTVFLVFFILEIIGMVMALMIRNPKRN